MGVLGPVFFVSTMGGQYGFGRARYEPPIWACGAVCDPSCVAADDRTDVEAGAALLKALASPLRLAIVLELQHEARCVHELVDALGASQPLVSQHLKTLRDAGLIAGTRRGREIEYRLADEHVLHVVQDAIAHALEPRG